MPLSNTVNAIFWGGWSKSQNRKTVKHLLPLIFSPFGHIRRLIHFVVERNTFKAAVTLDFSFHSLQFIRMRMRQTGVYEILCFSGRSIYEY